jgi:hypothetical protein
MALVNPNIAMSFRQPEFTPRNALAEYAQLQQIQGGQQAQELARFQLGAAQRAESVQNALTDAYSSSIDSTGNIDYNKLIGSLAKGGGASQIPSVLKTKAETTAAKLAQTKTQGEIDKNALDLQEKKFKRAWQSAGAAATPQIAIDQLTQAVKSGEIDMATATREIQNLQNMSPDQYKGWRANAILKLLDAKDQLGFMLPKVERQDIGGQIVNIQANPMMPGYGQPIAGAAITKTPTIAEITGQGQLNVSRGQLSLAQQRLAQEAQGVTYQQDAQGNIVALPSRLPAGGAPVARPVTGEGGAPVKGKLSPFAEKAAAQRTQMGKDLDFAIKELGEITKDGGLIDQSTGSGAGRLFDIGAGFVGQATPGAIAIGKIAPVSDLALKMVPRFEGPQSDKDTASYKEAAGQLADPTLPTKIRKEAGKTVLRLMQQRKGQFATNDMAAEGVGPAAGAAGGVIDFGSLK